MSCRSERAERLLNSLLYRGVENYNQIEFHSNNPIITTSKMVGEQITGQSCYVIAAGNSRCVLFQELIDAIRDLNDSEDTDFTFNDVSFLVSKFNHDIDAGLTAMSMFTEQIRDNTSVAMTPLQIGRSVFDHVQVVQEKFPDKSRKEQINLSATEFGITYTYVYDWIRFFEEYPEWFQNLAEGEGIAVDTLRLIFQAFKATNKEGKKLTLKEVYDQISGWAVLNNNGKITRGVVNEWKANTLLTPDNVPVEDEGSESEPSETLESTKEEKAPKTLATMPDVELDDLTENVALLQVAGNDLILKASQVIEDLTILDYDESEAIKILKALDRLVAVVEGTLTSADKQALADKKEKERLEKEAEKAAAKAEKEAAKAAKAAKRDPNEEFDPEDEIEVGGVTV